MDSFKNRLNRTGLLNYSIENAQSMAFLEMNSGEIFYILLSQMITLFKKSEMPIMKRDDNYI